MGHWSTQHSSHHAENTGKKKASLACSATQTLVHSAAWVLLQSQTFVVSSFSSSISWWTLGAVILLWELHLTPFSGDTTSGSCEYSVGTGAGGKQHSHWSLCLWLTSSDGVICLVLGLARRGPKSWAGTGNAVQPQVGLDGPLCLEKQGAPQLPVHHPTTFKQPISCCWLFCIAYNSCSYPLRALLQPQPRLQGTVLVLH